MEARQHAATGGQAIAFVILSIQHVPGGGQEVNGNQHIPLPLKSGSGSLLAETFTWKVCLMQIFTWRSLISGFGSVTSFSRTMLGTNWTSTPRAFGVCRQIGDPIDSFRLPVSLETNQQKGDTYKDRPISQPASPLSFDGPI